MEVFLSIVMLIFGILQIILFFKIWGMTNDIRRIRCLLERCLKQNNANNCISNRETKNTNHEKKDTPKGSWGKDVTEEEKDKAKGLIPKLMDNEVILLVKGKMIVYYTYNLSELTENYKVIYYK